MRAHSARRNFLGARAREPRVHARAHQGIHALYRSTHKKIYNFVQLEQLHASTSLSPSLCHCLSPLFFPLSPSFPSRALSLRSLCTSLDQCSEDVFRYLISMNPSALTLSLLSLRHGFINYF